MQSVVCVLLLVALAYSQNQPVFYIDDFETDSFPQSIQIPHDPTFPIAQTSSTQSSTVIGDERDLLVQIDGGQLNLFMSAGVSEGYFVVSTPNGASGSAVLTYDGTDASDTLNPSGLYDSEYSNFLQGGGFALSASIQTNISTTAMFSIYSGSTQAVCQATIDINGSPRYETYTVEYSQFSSGCEFSKVGAVEVEFMLPGNGDLHMQYLAVHGTVLEQLSTPTPTRAPMTKTATRTRTPIYSAMSTPTRYTSATRTPIYSAMSTPTRYSTATRTLFYSAMSTPTRFSSASRTPIYSAMSTPTRYSTTTRTLYYSAMSTPTRILSSSQTPSRIPSSSHTRTRAPTAAPPNCYSRLSPTSISPGTCMLLNSCTVTNKQNVYFQYNYSYEIGRNSNSSGLSYYFIPSEQPITGCSTLSKYCYSVCGATANPILGYVYLGDVNYHNFQLWAYYNNYNSNSANLFVNGTSVITYSN